MFTRPDRRRSSPTRSLPLSRPNQPLPDAADLPLLRLGDATVQELQLELIRRSHFNAFDGAVVADRLIAHQTLWRAVILDRLGFRDRPGLPSAGLIKLRDLDDNLWNADTLYLLVDDQFKAERLIAALGAEDLGGMVTLTDDPSQVDSALGGGDDGTVIVSIWWD